MKYLAAFLTSPTFGFLLKLFAALAAAGFGILGIGTETRATNGKLNRNGRIALTGILIAGLMATGTTIYEFVSSQRKEKDDREKSERLMLSVQRGIYPFRGITVAFTLDLSKDFEGLAQYKKTLRSAIARMAHCEQGKEISCYGFDGKKPYQYRVLSTSPLFPKPDSVVRIVLENLGLHVRLFKATPATSSGASIHTYKLLGAFSVDLWTHTPEEWWINYDIQTDHIQLEVDRYELPDNAALTAEVYSLADLIPGAVTVFPDYSDDPLCYALEQKGFSTDRCASSVLEPLNEMTLDGRAELRFGYPKAIVVSAESKLQCAGDGRKVNVAFLLEDIESSNQFGGGDSAISSAERQNLCDARKKN